MKKFITITALVVSGTTCITAQDRWSLEQCIGYAIEHNLSVKQQEATRDQQEVELHTAQWSRLPNLNGNIGQSFNFGRALQADNTYGNRNTRNTNFSLGTNIPLFTGMQIPNNIALCKLNLKAATEDLNEIKEDISIQVTSYYLQVLFNKELAKVAHEQVEQSHRLLDEKTAFFKSGKIAESEVYEAKARLAQDELSVVQADNNYQLALLDLSQLLNLPTPEGFEIVIPDTDNIQANISLPEDVYADALLRKPSIKAAQYRLEGASKTIRIAQSGLYPQLNFGAGLGTNYYKIEGMENASFSDQWSQNSNKYLQFSLSIPLFNRFATKNRIKSARIQQKSMSWQLEENKNALYKEIQQAHYNAIAAESKYRSSKSAIQAAEASFLLASEKYANGKASSTEYNEIRTNWVRSVSEGIQAKYDYLFRCKILDFYKGLPLRL